MQQQGLALVELVVPREFLDEEPPQICEDCGGPTDLGRKCRDCYDTWQHLLWQDIPKQHFALLQIARELNAIPQQVRNAIAELAPKGLSGSHAELFMRVKRCLEGPFKSHLEEKLEAIRIAAKVAAQKQTRSPDARAEME